MKRSVRLALLAASMIASLTSVANAQSGFSAADSKELASYRLTMDTTKKVFALMRAIGQEMANDPKFQALQKTKAEIAALSKKDELTDAESARLEKLEAQAEEQEEALAQANAGANMSNAKDLNQMEAAIKANPQFMAALTKVGLTAREYARWTIASLMAGMVAGFQKSGVLKELPKDLKEVNPENVKFIIDNEAELNAMRKEMEKLEK
jgi:hypothetical protein